MIAIVVLGTIGVIAALALLSGLTFIVVREWMKLRRKWRAMQSSGIYGIYLEKYQPLQAAIAWREPLEFEATKPCPHCGFFHTHLMAAPIAGDHKDAATVRKCKVCFHRWAEK